MEIRLISASRDFANAPKIKQATDRYTCTEIRHEVCWNKAYRIGCGDDGTARYLVLAV
jgi:hypothetical protein